MMAQELLSILRQIVDVEGGGCREVCVLEVDNGIPLAHPVIKCWAAEDYDGDLVWLTLGEPRGPEWAGGDAG